MAAKRLIRPTCCGVLLLLPDGGETPYPANELRVLLLLPDGGENALSGLRAAGSAFVAGWRRNALSGLRTAGSAFVAGWRRKRLIRPTNCGFCFCCRMRRKRLIRPDGPAFVGLISAAPSGNSQNPASERINASARRSALRAYLPASLSPRAGYRRRGYRSSYSYDRR